MASWGEMKLRQEKSEGVEELDKGGSEERSRVGGSVLETNSSRITSFSDCLVVGNSRVEREESFGSTEGDFGIVYTEHN